MNNKKSKKPSLFADTEGNSKKKASVLKGIEAGVEHNSSNINSILMLLLTISLIAALIYIAMSNVISTQDEADSLMIAQQQQAKQDKQFAEDKSKNQQSQSTESATAPVESATLIDVPAEANPLEKQQISENNADTIETAFDALNEPPTTQKKISNTSTQKKAAKTPKPKNTQSKHKKSSQSQATNTKADSGDIAVIQALLANNKVPTKPSATPTLFGELTEQPLSTNEVEALAVEQTTVPSPPEPTAAPQQALLSNGLNNQQLASAAGKSNNNTMLSGTKALIKKCEEMEELDAAICKWDVCDQYGGDESICSKEFISKKKSGFKLLDILGLD